MSDIMDKARMRKMRTINSAWLLLLLVAMIVMYRYSNDLLALMTGHDPEEIGDMGVDMLQTLPVVAMHLLWAVLLSLGVATFVEMQLKENAFNQWSRFGMVFLASMYFCSQVVSGLL